MRKLVFLQKEPLSRFGVSFLLTAGVTLPLLLALELGSYLPFALLLALAVLALLTVLNATPQSRKILWILCGAFVLLQLFLPQFGVLGGWLEATKALALYFSSYTVALPIFGTQVASLLTVLTAVLSYVFAKRGVGFLPAALVVVLVMFGLWSLGKGNLFWYVAPALVALLLQMAQAAHEKINILHVLPMALVAVLATFLLLPGGKVVIEPLATAATNLKQMISDYLFFTEPRNVFTLGTYGYYPMGNGQLGGAAEPAEYPVMMVKTDQKLLLRAVAKDQYSGRSFTDTSSAKRYLYINPRWLAQRRKAFLETLPSDAIRKASPLLDEKAIAIQIENRAASTVFTPLFLRSLQMENDMVAYFNDASELFITRDLQLGDHYTVYTPVFEGGQTGLDALVDASLKKDDYYQDIYNTYTQLPNHLEQKVFDDVKNIVQNAQTPYAKAMAIMRHLQKYYHYTLTPDTPPENKDFVTYFLYVSKEGYCTYYAAAMTVMCRMANLPARYVEGFLATPSTDGFAYVTGKDAHAWTEVYFEGFGWVPFDPTPLQQNNSNTPPQGNQNPDPSPSPSPSPEDQPTPTPTADPNQPQDQPSPSPQPSSEPEDQPDETPQDIPPDDKPFNFPWWILLVIAALAGLQVHVSRRSPESVARRAPTEKEKIYVYGAAVQHLLLYAKRTPKPGETPLTFAKRIDSVRAFPTPIAPLWRILTLSNYSRMEPTAEQTRRAGETYRQVFRGSHPLRRLRLLLTAAFDPRFYRVLDTPAPHNEPPKGTTFKAPKPAGKQTAYARNGGRPNGRASTGQRPSSGAKPAQRPEGAPPQQTRDAQDAVQPPPERDRPPARPDDPPGSVQRPERNAAPETQSPVRSRASEVNGHGTAPRQGTPPQRENVPRQGVPPQRENAPRQGTPPQRENPPRQGTPPQKGNAPRQGTPPQRENAPRQGVPSQRENAPRQTKTPADINRARQNQPSQKQNRPQPPKGPAKR